MSKFLAPDYQALVPYTPGEQLNYKVIKLNTNESPFPPSPKVKEAVSGELIDSLRLYSDPEVKQLRRAIAGEFGLNAENVFVGNGSDDVLAFSIMGFCGRGGEMCCPDISYGFYPVYADIFGVNLEEIPLENDLRIDAKKYCNKGKTVVIANPNAPTGLALSPDDIEMVIASNPGNVVIIDEAYMDFCKTSCVGLVNKYSNLLVCRTFSKSHSLAGMRVGYGLAQKELIDDLNKLKFSFNPYNMNSVAIAAASAAIADNEYYSNNTDKIIEIRENTKKQLASIGFTGTDSKSNFLFVRHSAIPAERLYTELRKKGILVRYFSKPRISDYLRITVGARDEMDALVSALKEIIKELS
ncbi:MAG: histidinol-phosphate transaminase [Clostridia bacterium]|nr:histidinol-phosphate transaminase [Clostridia bacterium]